MNYLTTPIDTYATDGKWLATFRYEPFLGKWFALRPDAVANRLLLLDTNHIPNAVLNKAKVDPAIWTQYCYKSPIKTQIQLNQNCNYQCPICYADSSKGKDVNESLTLDELDVLLSKLKNIGVLRINYVGGEVFLRDDFEDIVELTLEKNLLVSCITNARIPGQNINKYHDLLMKMFNIQVSCNGIGKSYENEYKTDSWEKSSQAIINVLSNSRANILSYVITENNYGDIPQFITFAANHAKPSIVKFGSLCWSGRGSNEKALRYYKNILPVAKKLIEEGRYRYPKINIQSQLDLGTETPLWEDYANGYRPLEFYYSPDGRDGLYVNSIGDIYPFPLLSDRNDFLLGNVRNDDIKAIWTSHPMLRELRSVTFDKSECGKLGCKQVCGLWTASYMYSWSGNLSGKVPCEFTDWKQ